MRVHNYGAAFSFLSDAGGWQRYGLSVLAAIVSVIIVVWISRQPVQRWLESLALALILGGALGNLYDRVTLGYVVDFLDFHWSLKTAMSSILILTLRLLRLPWAMAIFLQALKTH